MQNRSEETGAICMRPLRSIIPSLALLSVVALAGSVLTVPTVAAVGDDSAQTLRVTVMDAAGNLLSGAKVSATDAEGLDVKATEQPDGAYVIKGVWAKTILEVDHPWFVPGSFELALPDQRVVQVEVILGKANPVAVIIQADKPVAPGGGGAGKADLSAQRPSILIAGDASGGILAAGGLCDGTEIPENEPDCGLPIDTVNGGCNSVPPIFSPIACGDTYCGTAAWDGAFRDTDWYEIITTENTEFTWTVTASFAFVIGYVPTFPLGSGDCATVTVLDPFAVGTAGQQISIVTDCLPPGIHWFFVGPDFAGPTFLCGPDYVATLTCNVPCELPPGPCDDAAGDCCQSNGTPGCEDPDCCEIVCAIDPFCCDMTWDGICAGEAEDLCGQLCFPTLGACCLTEDLCFITTEEDCAAQGGVYQGDDTDCGGLVYPSIDDCVNPFEDISGSGIVAPNASSTDDAGDIVPIGFTFNFYGDDHTDIGVASNGYLTFGADLSDFTNDSIPDPVDPNDGIYPYWDDWSPNQAGTVYYETKGAAPNRRFIAQWDGVEHFGGDVGELATFQAILFEGTNCIEFRYGGVLFFDSPTVGIENQDGTVATPGGFGPPVGPGDCKVICPELVKNPCAPTCLADIDGSGDVGVKDLLFLLGAWGDCPAKGPCLADFDDSGDVGVKDLLFLLGAWGDCP
ncbi:MAG: carboxypeptidase-like regulatory domain-containing protein [Phycisphaerae bacterium]